MIPYRPFDHLIFRTPLFPFERLNKDEDLMNNNAFADALLIASPELSKEVSKLLQTSKMPEKEKNRVIRSLYRYYQRACVRPTPFGLFAGCSVGAIGERTEILLAEQQKYRRTTRLDMNYICALTQLIEKDKNIRKQLMYYPNSSIYPVSDRLRYVEYHYSKTRRVHRIEQVKNSDYIQTVLDLARNGAIFSELAASLCDDKEAIEDATDFIHELIDAQLLVSELEPAVTNVQPLSTLISKLNKLPIGNSQIVSILTAIETQLNDIDRLSVGESIRIYPEIIQHIKKTNVEAEIKYLFQTDLFKPVQQATVSHKLIRDIQQALIFLNKISPPASRSNLTQFRENFFKRYEEREMPLLFVLDNELGIGYTDNASGDISPLVDDLPTLQRTPPSTPPQSPIVSMLLRKNQQFANQVIVLKDEDVKGIETGWEDLPLTLTVRCQLLQDNEQGRSVYIQSVGGHSAASILGRFCHLDEQILNQTLAITEKEASMYPDVVFAEIVHLPESRIGNILLRPVLRPYEIPYLAKAGVDKDYVISPDDLYVSVKGNHILLRSRRLNREIIPRMSTAHNYSGMTMPVYYFLGDLQNQKGRIGLRFSWQEAAHQHIFLPRVVYRNCILSKARWTVRGKETKAFVDIKDDSELLRKIKEWQEGRNIPDRVLLADGDNELYIDLNNPLSIRAWLSVVKTRPSFFLEEFLFNPETAVVRGPEGVFTNEFVFAFYKE